MHPQAIVDQVRTLSAQGLFDREVVGRCPVPSV